MQTKLNIAANIAWAIAGIILGLSIAQWFFVTDEANSIRIVMLTLWLLCLQLCDALWVVRICKYGY